MATMIGTVKTLSGTVTAADTDGKSRNLQAGSNVHAEELITTGVVGVLVIEFSDGSTIDLGRNSQIVLDSDVYDPTAPDSVGVAEAEAASIQAEVLAGVDPTDIAEATAAGAGTAEGNEGADFVQVDYLAPEVTPTSGFDTTGISVAFPEIEEQFQTPVVDEPSEPEDVPIQAPAVNDPSEPEDVPMVSISTGIDGGSAVEGNDVTFTVSQNIISSADTTVIIEVLSLPSDSAAEGADYEVIDTVTVVIPADSNFNTFNVATHIDALEEGNETFTARIVSVSNPNGTVGIGAALATGTILDDYLPPEVSISTGIEGGSAVEGNDVTFTVSQDIISNEDTSVTVEVLSLASDSAIEGKDYEVIDTVTVVIPSGSGFNTFDVTTHLDALEEGNEIFTARIVSATNPNGTVEIGVAAATGTILDQYDSPLGGDTIYLSADEALIVDTVIDNSLTFTAGTADLTSFQFDTDLSSLKLDTNDDGVEDVSWNRVSDIKIEGLIGSSVAVTLTLTASTITAGSSADVTVQAVLDNAFQHLAIPGQNPLDLGNIKVIASTVGAGDEVTGTAFMAVVDDIIEITSITNANLTNLVGAEASGDLVIDSGADGLASLTFNGTVPLGLTTFDGHEISYQSQADGSLKAVDANNDSVFSLTQNDTGDGYTIALDQLLQGPVVETTITLSGSAVDAGSPVGSVTQVSQNGILVNLSATDSSGPDLINASSDGYGVDNGLVEEGGSEIAIIALADPAGSFSDMSVTVGNFSATGNSNDIYSYQLYLNDNPVGDVHNVVATASNNSTNTTISINGSGFDEIQMWASHSGGNANSEGSYKIISVNSDVTATSYEDVILNFGVDAIDTDGDFHGGDFQVAVDINNDFAYLPLDNPSLDTLINDTVDEFA
jgi:hypothetical protein